MALSRKFLTALGIEEDKVDEIIKAHSETVEALKEERDGYKDKADKYDKAKNDLEAANKKIEEMGKEDAYKVKYEAIKEDFDAYKKGIEAEKTTNNKREAYKALLMEVGISEKRIDAVTRVAELDKIKLDKDGKIEGADDLKKSIKEDWADFIVTEGEQGADPANPPGGSGAKKTKEEIFAIKDTAERQKAMLENKDLFI